MPGFANTLLIEGSFEELCEELAHYIDNIKSDAQVHSEVVSALQQNKKDDALNVLVKSSATLNAAPEREFVAAYNLLIHLVRQSPSSGSYLPTICKNLSAPITTSPTHGGGLTLSVLSTLFNSLNPEDNNRYHVFLAILRVVKTYSTYDSLRPQLRNLDAWLEQWQLSEENQRRLYLAISEVAQETGEEDAAYDYLVKALRTIPSEEASDEEARDLSIRALRTALVAPIHYDFQDLNSLDSIQALRNSAPVYYQLLEVFTAEQLEDLNDFEEEHNGWIEEQDLDAAVLYRKMRLLTLASLAASTGSDRSLPYAHIARALQIPSEEVEMWVIDVIRAGLVEGKLSQLNQTFLIHRSTYRVFGEKQWIEVASRLDGWKASLRNVLEVIREEKAAYIAQREQELRAVENKTSGVGGYRRQQQQQQQAHQHRNLLDLE